MARIADAPATAITTFANLDDDPDLELIQGHRAIKSNGMILWDAPMSVPSFSPAIADVTAEPGPEVIAVASPNLFILNGRTGALLQGPIDIGAMGRQNPMFPGGGGPPTVANFIGGMGRQIGVATRSVYAVYNGQTRAFSWARSTQDVSSGFTGSSVFDFDADDRAEVLYNDENTLRVYNGVTGADVLARCNTTYTAIEYPLVADADADFHADIISVGNNYQPITCADGGPTFRGVRMFSSRTLNWAPTRRIWNQHTYHVTNINEDGTVPRRESANWSTPGLNNFRQNIQPDLQSGAPDLTVGAPTADLRLCPTRMTLYARVFSRGRIGVGSGVPVLFYATDRAGMRMRIGQATTRRSLAPGQDEVVSFLWMLPPGRESENWTFTAVVADPMAEGFVDLHECNTMNNSATGMPFACVVPG